MNVTSSSSSSTGGRGGVDSVYRDSVSSVSAKMGRGSKIARRVTTNANFHGPEKIVFFANGLHAQCHRIRHDHIPAILVASLCLPAWPWPSSPTCDKQILRPLHFYLPTIFRGPTQKCHPRSSTRCQNSENYVYISIL